MTYREYITKTLNKFFLSPDDIDILMLNQGIEADADVNVLIAKMAIYKEFSMVLPMANINEGGTSVTWISENVKVWYSLLASELGMPDLLKGDDLIRDYSNDW